MRIGTGVGVMLQARTPAAGFRRIPAAVIAAEAEEAAAAAWCFSSAFWGPARASLWLSLDFSKAPSAASW